MAIPAESSFIAWKFAPEEELGAAILSLPQKQLIQNDIAAIAERILTLTFNPLDPIKFAQDDAHAKGQLSILKYLLDRSNEAEQALISAQQPE